MVNIFEQETGWLVCESFWVTGGEDRLVIAGLGSKSTDRSWLTLEGGPRVGSWKVTPYNLTLSRLRHSGNPLPNPRCNYDQRRGLGALSLKHRESVCCHI